MAMVSSARIADTASTKDLHGTHEPGKGEAVRIGGWLGTSQAHSNNARQGCSVAVSLHGALELLAFLLEHGYLLGDACRHWDD